MNVSENRKLKVVKGIVKDKVEINELTPLILNNGKVVKKKERTLRSFIKKLKIIKANITVEPIVTCYIMSSTLASLTIQNFNLEKACLVNLNFSEEICEALKNRQTENYTMYEEQVQTLIDGIQAWKNIIQTAIPVLIILFVGAWSDKTGKRKACILIPILGELLSSIGFIINTCYFYELPVEVAAITESIFPAITGGWYTNHIGIFSYITDITTSEERTYRVGIVILCISLGYPIGSALSGVLLRFIGYYGIFSISACIYLCSVIYGYCALKDPKKSPVNEKSQGCFAFIRDIFDISLVMETLKVAFKKNSGNRRLRVCMLLIVVFVVFGPTQDLNGMRLNSVCGLHGILTNLVGTAFSISLFSNYLKLDDTLLGIISNASKIVAAFAYAFARTDLEIYIAPLLEILNGTYYIAMRSIATKLVSGDEIGKINSLFALVEAMTPLVYGPLYSQVYVATLNVLPGAVFLLGALLTVPSIFIFGWLYFEHQKDTIRKSNDLEFIKTQNSP